ncbi:TIGR04282 family arsenosugar biosynthesis glycosyltransferase [Balneola sp. MJW-20]|uniref:TIGR04282 family arsenosugar biosynthesis glycosyltransferase n=1 Tax=Gracilimonas aurantiaca TaxID=3234185 RepID=UPI0034653958
MKAVLIIFVKNRVPGKVKTRLAADLGDIRALEVYEKLLKYTRSVMIEADTRNQVWFSGEVPDGNEWNKSAQKLMVQPTGNLGEKMSHAFRWNFEQGAEKVMIIGSDCAEITSGHIKKAITALNDKDLVIGPAKDGGYYLLAMKTYYPEIFNGVDWSTSKVLMQTLNTAERLGLESVLLEELNDVDELEDWNEVRHKFE